MQQQRHEHEPQVGPGRSLLRASERVEDPVPFQSKAATTTETAANGHAAAAEGRRTDGRKAEAETTRPRPATV